jgi:glycyl-tRNA synthetase beta chain
VTLIDLFSIGEKPSGVKDPFALRRAAISIIRILIECDINLDLIELINKNFPSDQEENKDYLIDFIFDRLQNFIKDRGYETLVVQSVCDSQPRLINDIILKVEAVNEFKKIDISENLAQSNKRVLNILKKYENSLTEKVNQDLLESDSEKLLYQSILKVTENNKIFLEAKNYKSLLNNLIHLSEPIDNFFEDTMVNADNKNIKHNRHLLLSDLNKAMNIIANLSVLGS